MARGVCQRLNVKIMRKAKSRTILLSLLLSIGMLQPLSVSAQGDGSHGLFEGGKEVQNNGLLNRGSISTDGLTNQFFGETTLGITNETFGNTTPVGEGLIVMLLSGAGYLALKKKKNESN